MVNTHVLFTALLQNAGADCLCDIGSRDGEDALGFRNLFPKARVFAFEANPYNYNRMQADPRFAAANVVVLPYAISDADGEATFYVSDVTTIIPRKTGGRVRCSRAARLSSRRPSRWRPAASTS